MKLKPIEDMEFIIQTVNGKVVNDFSFELLQSFEFLKWRNNEFVYYILRDEVPSHIINVDRYVPIGTVEFVREFQQKYYPNAEEALIPLNVPEELMYYAGSRWIANVNDKSDMSIFDHDFDMGRCTEKELFRKSLTTIKDPSNGFFKYDGTNFEDFKGYQVSEKISIDSEWRVFVFKNEIQHIANYSGDCMIFPDADKIKEMVNAYTNAPVAYTLDVGVSGDSTFIIECHRFFSCGLYGFNDYSILPYMFSQEWFEMKNINKIKK